MIEECIAEVRIWMVSPRLLINDIKTEFLIIGSYQQLSKVSIESKPVECVRNLGAWFDIHMSMDTHASKFVVKLFMAYIPSGK